MKQIMIDENYAEAYKQKMATHPLASNPLNTLEIGIYAPDTKGQPNRNMGESNEEYFWRLRRAGYHHCKIKGACTKGMDYSTKHGEPGNQPYCQICGSTRRFVNGPGFCRPTEDGGNDRE